MRVPAYISLLAFAGLSGAAAAQEQFQIFGLPLGAKMPNAVKACAPNLKTSNTVCWLDRPSIDKDKKQTGRALLPDDKSPGWAGRGEVRLTITSTGILENVRIGRMPIGDESVIRSSIERRFGGPSDSGNYPSGSYARWAKAEADIKLICPIQSPQCIIEFLSGAEFRRREAAKEAEAIERLRKPLTP
ncbi:MULTISPECIES: hypothetical protein [unclassified Variovorax]|jgi:hypothetical protein|uniref:hypothetical protein n=1 Tax=unclassified Variovorax TaxID=663243 RepID=UPI000F7F0F20|nr:MULTISPECIES: hypothetical protein [unclassified Variovorax]RSZ47490.1 hypothetical protein EJO70_02405 [Variovorax sp. 553]RSZ48385.1 hypothetical protein EJO71_01565 [Variovorax sp. 679]